MLLAYTKNKFAIAATVLMAVSSLLISPVLQHEMEDVCFANGMFVSIDCMQLYNELLSPAQISDTLFVTHDVSAAPVQGNHCDADELHIMLAVEDRSTGSSVPFQTVAILLIPMNENHHAVELTEGTHGRIYDASFMNGVYGERINCFRPESSIILMSYGDTVTGTSKNSASITLKTLPGVEWMEIFVQFKIESNTVVEDVIYFEYLSPDYYEDDSLTLPKSKDVPDINSEDTELHSVRKRAEPRPPGFLSNMSRTELRRGPVRFTDPHGDSRKFGRMLAAHSTHGNETFTLTHSRRGHPRGHIANNSAASVKHFVSSSDVPKPPSSVFDIIASKRGRPRWQATHEGQRSFTGIHEHEDPVDMTLLKLRRGPHRYAIRSNNSQQNRQLHLSQHDPLSHIVKNENTELVELRRGHVSNKRLPGHRGRGLAATAGEESHEPDDGPFHLTQAKRGHKGVKYKPTLGHRSIHLHTPEDSKTEFNASMVQLRRGAKQRTKQDKLKPGEMFSPSALEARPTRTRDMIHLPSGRGVMPTVSKPSPAADDSGSKKQSQERKTKTKVENTKTIKDNDSKTKTKSASQDGTKKSKPRKSQGGPELKAGMTKLHLERIGADYIPKPVLIYSGCGKEYSCFNYPKDCHKSKKCAVAMSYRVDEMGRIHVVLLAVSKHYVAVGFSKDKLMGDEAVVTCKRIPGTYRVAIWKSYNVAGSGLNSRNNQVETNHTDVEPISGAVYKGVITCDFTMPMVMQFGRSKKVDFKTGKYYILLATGANNKEPRGPGSITYHGFSVSTGSPVSLSSKSAIASSPASNYFISVHIFLAIVTYGFFMPLAIFMARYGQEAYPHKSVKGLPKWVIIHLIFQVLTILCNTVSAIFAFLGRSGASFATFSSFYHFAIGIAISVLPLINAALGLLIHSKKSKEKAVMPALRTFHYLIGHLTFAFGAVELIRGPYLPKSVASCSAATLAGYWVLFYSLANLLLMFNTDYLRRLQGKKESVCFAFMGPAIQLDIEADRSQYDVRRGTIVFMFFIAFFFTVFLCILFALSPTGCRQGVPGYI